MATTLNMTLLLRRDDFTAEAKKSYVLQAGEPGYCTVTKAFKVGDGTTTWENLGFANKAQIEALIKIVDDKVAALNDTYATDAEVEEIRAALAAAIDLKLDKATYETDKATFALKSNVETEFAKYTTTEAQTAIDAEQDRRIKALEDDRVTEEELANAIKDFETIANVDLVRTDITNITKEGGLIDNAKAAVIGTADDAAVADTIYGAKKYAKDLVDAIPEQTDYSVTCTDEEVAATETTAAYKRHTLTQNGNTVCTIDVPRDLVLKSGYVDGENDELVLVLVNDEEIRVDVSHLIEYVTGDTATDGVITVNVSDDFVATATINDGTITSAKFADEVDTYVDDRIDSKISTYNTTTVAPIAARVKAIEDAPYTTKKYVDDQDAATLEAAKAYADAKEHKDTTYVVAATENALEFTVTPSEGEAQTITLVAPTVDVGVTKVTAGTDIVVTPEVGTGEVTVAHATYDTGIIKAAEGTEEPNFVTSVTINNGHVTSATVQTLKAALESMEFILDGGHAE